MSHLCIKPACPPTCAGCNHAISEQDVRSFAIRYAFILAEHQRYDPVCHLSWKRNSDRNGSEWVNTADLNSSVDAAMKEQQP